MDHDYANPYHVDFLFKNMWARDITDWHGLGLILWDVHEILTTKIDLTSTERQLMKHVAAGYETDDFTFDMTTTYYRVVEKFATFHQLEKQGSLFI